MSSNLQERDTPAIDTLLTQTSQQARREANVFRDYLKTLPEKRWLNKSFCSDWTIKDVAEHQAAQGMALHDLARAMMHGKENLQFSASLLRVYQEKLKDFNRLELADRIAASTHEFYDLVERATPEQMARLLPSRFGELSLASLGSLRLTELSLHSWDVRVVEDLTTKISKESLPLLLPGLVAALPALANQEVANQFAPTNFQFELTGAVRGPVALSVAHGKLKADRSYTEQPDVVVKLDSEAFLRLSWGRLNLDWMVRDGWVKVEGDTEAALKLKQLFKGV